MPPIPSPTTHQNRAFDKQIEISDPYMCTHKSLYKSCSSQCMLRLSMLSIACVWRISPEGAVNLGFCRWWDWSIMKRAWRRTSAIVLEMLSSVKENYPMPQEIILGLFRGSQLPLNKTHTNLCFYKATNIPPQRVLWSGWVGMLLIPTNMPVTGG